MKKICFALLISLIATAIQAQDVSLEWAKSIGGTNQEQGYSITSDEFGNVFVTGTFEGTVDFDPGSGTFNMTSTGAKHDVFIQKLDASGNFIWAKSMGGLDYDNGSSISVDSAGNVYVTGYYGGTADFDPGVATFYLTSNGSTDFYIQKLDNDGNFVWAKSIGGTGGEWARSISTDASGNVYVTGFYEDSVDFDPGTATFYLTAEGWPTPGVDLFTLKLDSNGNFMWANSMGGTGYESHSFLTVDASGNVYVTGHFGSLMDFDPGPDIFNLIPAGSHDIFIQKLDANGNFLWAKSMGGASSDQGKSIAVDGSGNVYTTGFFEDTADFDPDTSVGAIFNLTSAIAGVSDIFVQKLDADGNFIWAASVGGIWDESPKSISTDASGNVYVTGSYKDSVDFDPGPGTFNITSNGNEDIFILNLDSDGNFVWAKSTGGTFGDTGLSINIDASGNLYVTGNYAGTVDFDPGAATSIFTSNGSSDFFIQKFGMTVGIEDSHLLNNTSIYPNPTQGKVNIDLESLNGATVKVFTLSGQLIYHMENINASIHPFELNEAPGVYFIEISSQGKSQHYKLLNN